MWAAAVVLLVPACGGGGSDDAGDPPATSSASTTTVQPTTTTTSLEDAVRETYAAYVAMLDRVTTTTVDPNDPELAMRMIDPVLSDVRTQLSTWHAQGQVWIDGDETRHDVERVAFFDDAQTAVVTDCVVANDALVAVGATEVTLPPTETNLGRTTMVKRDGMWLVQDTDQLQHWDGVAGCAA